MVYPAMKALNWALLEQLYDLQTGLEVIEIQFEDKELLAFPFLKDTITQMLPKRVQPLVRFMLAPKLDAAYIETQ